MFGELQSVANLAKYPANAPLDSMPRVTSKISSEKRLERFGLLYGACQPMRDLFRGLDRLSRSTAPVMILGESGSGKELVATTLHHLSPRKDRPFIAVNCGAIPENLIESELFGHERGSFTGAARTHRGCFERADGGTLFLDEVTEMPVEMQVRLLRVLETGTLHARRRRSGNRRGRQGARGEQSRSAAGGSVGQAARRPDVPAVRHSGQRPAAARSGRRCCPAGGNVPGRAQRRAGRAENSERRGRGEG